jgi:tripartite-type tricarboxylate transporter receptor subunit TctC
MFKIILTVAAFGLAISPAMAAWPDDKPTEVVVGFAAGGGTDVMARKLLPYVEKRIGGAAKFIVVNRPGAAGEIAVTSIARAAPDGSTIGIVNVPGYNFIPLTRTTQYSTDNLRLVARVVDDPSVIVVSKDSKFDSLRGIVDALKSKPGSVTFGHNGAGTNGHLALRMLAKTVGAQTNDISYKGTAAQRTDLLGGHLDVGMLSVSEVPELHGGMKGELKVLAILAKTRSPALPDVPTSEEVGAPVIMSAERGFAVPKAVPDAIVKRLEAAIADSIKDPEYIRSSPGDASVLAFMTGAEWQSHLDRMTDDLRPLAEEIKALEKK